MNSPAPPITDHLAVAIRAYAAPTFHTYDTPTGKPKRRTSKRAVVHDTSISISGLKLIVDDGRRTLTGSEIVEPLIVTSGRILSPWHEISLYKSEASLRAGIASYDASCEAKGIADYVMVEMEAPVGFYEASVQAVAESLHSIQGGAGEPSVEFVSETASKMDRLEYIVYFVPQLLSADQYLAIVKADADLYAEIEDWVGDLEGDELLESLQSNALSAQPRVERDYFEIGYPAKFRCKLLDEEGWTIRKVHRRGTFSRNSVLTDTTLLNEIGGDAGTTGQRLKRSILLSEKGEVAQLAKDVDECLSNNPVWQALIREQVAEAQAEFPLGEIEVSIFAPTTGLMTLFYAMREDGILFVPSYSLTVSEGGEIRRAYIGELKSEDDMPKGPKVFQNVIAKYYQGDLFALLMTTTWGAYEARDLDILEDLGLLYSSFRCDVDGDDRAFFRRKNGRWRAVDPIQPFGGFSDYSRRNQRLFRLIHAKLSPRIGAGIWDGSSAVMQLEELVEDGTISRGKYYSDPPAECDVCTIPLADERFISDGRLEGSHGWANMCADCTVYHGAGIGWGTGQLYRKEANGRWLMVAGSSPEVEDNDG